MSLPLIILANKCDDSLDALFEAYREMLEGDWVKLPVSAETGPNFDALKRMVYKQLDIIRVYAKPPGKEADLEKPFILKKGSTISELGRKIHRDFSDKLKTARVWGSSTFEGQMVQRDYVLQDGDIVELRV